MYACVLIPRGLSLVLTLHPDPRNVLEMSASVWSNRHLPPGALLHPDEGELRLDKLEVYSVLRHDDIRREFGCYDVIQDVDGQEVRHCNWLRFVKVSSDPHEVNVIGSKFKGQVLYQVIKPLKPNDELVVLLHAADAAASLTDASSPVSMTSRHHPDKMTSSNHPGRTPSPHQYDRMRSPRCADRMTSHSRHSDRTTSDYYSDRMTSPHCADRAPSQHSDRMTSPFHSDRMTSHYTDRERHCWDRDTSPPRLDDVTADDEDDENIDVGIEDVGMMTTHEGDDNDSGDNSEEKKDDSLEAGKDATAEDDVAMDMVIKKEETGEDLESSEADVGFFSDSKGDHSELSEKSDVTPEIRVGHLEHSDDNIDDDHNDGNDDTGVDDSKERLHRSESSDHSSPVEHRTTPSEILERVTCPMSSSRVLAPDGGVLPLEGVSVRRARERTWWPCDVCPKKFDRPSLLKRHVRTHTGEKPHACDVCGKAFSTSSSLNTHRRIHSGEKPHQCPICGKRFTASSNLYYHRMTHNKEKPHKCTLCSKSFPTPGDLRSHMYVHSGSWPYRCSVCNRGFSKHTNLKNHLLLHSGDKPHECSKCGKRFALQCNLKTHLKTHEAESATSCLKCGVVFSDTDRKMADGACSKCHLLPSPPHPHPHPHPPPASISSSDRDSHQIPHHHRHPHPHHPSPPSAKVKAKKRSPSDFSIDTLTHPHPHNLSSSSSPPSRRGKDTSPELYNPGMQQRIPSSSSSPVMPAASPFGAAFYGHHRPWMMAAAAAAAAGGVAPVTSSSPLMTSLQYSTSSPTLMAGRAMQDMVAALPAYAMFGGKTPASPVPAFISPEALARGAAAAGFLPAVAAAHASSSPFPLTPTSGWKPQQSLAQGM